MKMNKLLIVINLVLISFFELYSQNIGYTARPNGNIYKTSDGGVNWGYVGDAVSGENDVVAISFVKDESSNLSNASSYSFQVYPNPTSDFATFNTFNVNSGTIILRDVRGETVMIKNFTSNKFTLNLQSLNNRGLYIIEIFDSRSNIISRSKLLYK